MLKTILENKQFIFEDDLLEKFIYRDKKLYVVYYHKRKLLLYEWNLKTPLAKAEICNFSGLFYCRFISTDYLILDDKQYYYFYSLNQKIIDRFASFDGLLIRFIIKSQIIQDLLKKILKQVKHFIFH